MGASPVFGQNTGPRPAGGVVTTPLLAPTTPTNCTAPSYSFQGNPNTGYGYFGSSATVICSGGAIAFVFGGTDLYRLAFGNDVVLTRDNAANILAMKDGANGQTFRVYNIDSGPDDEYAALTWSTNKFNIQTVATGSGNTRSMFVGPGGGAASLNLQTAGTARWQVNSSGHLLAFTDNTYDIGANGATRPRNGYFGSSLFAGGSIESSTQFQVGSRFVLAGGGADGRALLTNFGGTDFGRLMLGGTTSAFPSIKRNGAELNFRLADDSGWANIESNNLVSNNIISAVAARVTAGAGAGITVNQPGVLQRQVYKVTVDRTAFVCAALTCDVTIATLPAKTVVLGVYGSDITNFACASTCATSTLSMTLGTSAGGTQLLASFDADSPASSVFGDVDAELGTALARAAAVQGGVMPNYSGTNIVNVRLTSGTGNIGNGSVTNLSQGSITFYLVTERLP